MSVSREAGYNMKKLVAVAGALVVIGLVGLGCSSTRGMNHVMDNVTAQVPYNKTMTLNMSRLSNVLIDSDTGSVHVVSSAGTQMTVHISGSMSQSMLRHLTCSVSTNGSQAQVLFKRQPGLNLLEMDTDITIQVDVPKKQYDLFDVNCGTGDVHLDSLLAGHVTVNEGTGDVTITNMSADMTVHSGTGSITMTGGKLSNLLNVTTGTGDVRIQFPQEPKNMQYDLKTGTGDIQFFSQQARHQLSGVEGKGGSTISVDTGTGGIDIGNGSAE
jgi:hypothetical protein